MEKEIIAFNAKNTGEVKKDNRGYAEPWTKEQVDNLLAEPWLKNMVNDIRNGNEEQKEHLPFICPHYSAFRNNHRAQADIIPEAFTYMTCVDVDDKDVVEKAIKGALALNQDEYSDWQGQVLRIEYSARKKAHIYIRIPKGKTISEAQQEFCQEVGVAFDENCTTPERFIFVTGKDEEVYRSENWLEPLSDEELAERREAYLDRGLDVDGRPLTNETPIPQVDNESKIGLVDNLKFKGIPYSTIIAEWWNRNGGEPEEGERNVKLHKLAVNLRAICDNKKEVLMKVMPRYGLTEMEFRSIIDSACKETPKGISKMMSDIIKGLERSVKSEDLDGEGTKQMVLPKRLRNALPVGLKETLAGIPVNMHLPVLCSVMPIAGAYADEIRVVYVDGNTHRLNLMTIVRGEQASNKSVCKNAVDVWRRQFDEEDAIARKREEEWKEHKKARRANEKAPEDPHVMIRVVPITISCSTLLKRMKNAAGHTLFSFSEEIDTLRKTNGAGSWSAKYDVYRYGFDNGEWGQDYNSDQAESGVVNVAYNWTILGTNGAVRKCFKGDNIENGLSSRILIAEMPDGAFAKLTKFRKRTADEEARIQEAVTKLRNANGEVEVPRLQKAIEKWLEERRIEAAMDIDRVKDTYRRRAAVIAFRCGVIFHILEGTEKESKACIDFALLMADYCLEGQMKLFGEALKNQYVCAQDECQRYSTNHSIFDQLAPTFTRDDLRALKQGTTDSGLRNVIMRWKNDGWIEPVDRQHFRKTSQCPTVPRPIKVVC